CFLKDLLRSEYRLPQGFPLLSDDDSSASKPKFIARQRVCYICNSLPRSGGPSTPRRRKVVPDLRCSWVSAFAAQGGVSLIYPWLMTPEAENRKTFQKSRKMCSNRWTAVSTSRRTRSRDAIPGTFGAQELNSSGNACPAKAMG